MRKPDGIKKGLEICGIEYRCPTDCRYCPYVDTKPLCNGRLSRDALAYIRQLEAQVEQLEAQVGKDKDVPRKKRICPITGLDAASACRVGRVRRRMIMDKAQYKEYNIPEITRILLKMRDNCIRHESSDTYDDPERQEKYEALNDAVDLLNNPSRVPRWISVKERLPEGEDPVLILVKETEHYGLNKEKRKVYFCQYLAYWDGDEWFTAWCNGCRKISDTAKEPYADDYEVTHWMPLPEPPKEGT